MITYNRLYCSHDFPTHTTSCWDGPLPHQYKILNSQTFESYKVYFKTIPKLFPNYFQIISKLFLNNFCFFSILISKISKDMPSPFARSARPPRSAKDNNLIKYEEKPNLEYMVSMGINVLKKDKISKYLKPFFNVFVPFLLKKMMHFIFFRKVCRWQHFDAVWVFLPWAIFEIHDVRVQD